MLGAIIGDIVGSMYEGRRYRIKTKDFPFFGDYCRYTDDTVCTTKVWTFWDIQAALSAGNAVSL